jgi:uncharacterized transporter YbjL
MMGTASGALEQLGLPPDLLKQQQANIAAGYAVTYICGYILVLLFVPLIAPRLMGVNLKEEAEKLEAELSGALQARWATFSIENFDRRPRSRATWHVRHSACSSSPSAIVPDPSSLRR